MMHQKQHVSRWTGLRFKLKKRVYSLDTIVVNSPLPPKELRAMLPLAELKKHSKPKWGGRMIFPASNTGKYHGYQSKLVAYACTDEFMEILGKYDFGVITHLQICEDRLFDDPDHAEQFSQWMIQHVTRKWAKNSFVCKDRGLDSDKKGDTLYSGKKKGSRSKSYCRSYQRKSKLVDSWCYHHEFVFNGNDTVRDRLGIRHLSELGRCDEMYWSLKERYLKIPRFEDRDK